MVSKKRTILTTTITTLTTTVTKTIWFTKVEAVSNNKQLRTVIIIAVDKDHQQVTIKDRQVLIHPQAHLTFMEVQRNRKVRSKGWQVLQTKFTKITEKKSKESLMEKEVKHLR